MGAVGQLQEAKNKLSEVVERASREGPQRITKRGKVAAVVLSAKDYERLQRGEDSLVAFFERSPLRGANLDLERSKDPSPPVDL